MLLLFLVLSFLLCFIALTLFFRCKLKKVWQRLWLLDKQILANQQQMISMQKELVLLQQKNLRLTPLMPSQHGEDLVLGRYFGYKKQGFYVEVGAYQGVDLSNSYFFEALGWDGLLIEPNPHLYQHFSTLRPYSEHYNMAVSNHALKTLTLSIVPGNEALSYSQLTQQHAHRVEQLNVETEQVEVACDTLSAIIGDREEPIDFISIDVEGAELDVLESLDFSKHAPEVFVIEDNSHGHDQTIKNFLNQYGYQERYRMECNVFYLHENNDRKIGLG